MNIFFADLNNEVVAELSDAFRGVPNVICQRMEVGQACSVAGSRGHKAVVDCGNCHSLQGGGIDGAISRLLSTPWQSIESITQKLIDDNFIGQQPIGSAILVPSPNPIVKFMVYAPTMMVPERVCNTYNAYVAFRAALLEVWRHNVQNPKNTIDTVICGGLCTGAGLMNPMTSARQMRLAWDSLAHPIPHVWSSVWQHHKKLLKTFETM